MFLDILIKKKVTTHFGITQGAWQKDNGLRIDHMLVSNSFKSISLKKLK